ncbi:LysR family transcriptional regulator YbhD [Pseudonocardia sp. Ae406_Ps2]|uniref:LysR family transcriptional regulator n=1 Tax=unclassified Pseudonocardia TaxID=2619320 RepID=UPI00094ACE44|nr:MULTISPECIES: LysR substrate-binding domain-containing protein [unclassified Pseudonocardia]OLM00831.1 LysR family transcriptional regulator YbhD [Pseudonocardia sp. Ae406_Ps2]OLM07378.1 LysR family transcriptional regulator YbhD [Pseudonocardia sp. Ae331_Ps2]OLM22409.1 LysR family transcriptional regulator YbhD [Pseudonocardia sp. Ae706_Ps2]
MDLTLQQLRAVVAVHEAGGFTAASAVLRTAQPSLSRTVADVERLLGARLFERTTRRLEPTPVGETVVAAARRALDGVATELRHVEHVLDGLSGTVRIATLPSLAAILLPGVVSAFRRERPGVRPEISDALADEVTARVRSGRADLAVTVVHGRVPDDLVVTPVAADRFCALVPPTHPLAGRSTLRWAELDGVEFVDFDSSTSIRQHVDRALDESGCRPGRGLAARNIAAVAGLVAAGLGATAVPGLVVPLTGFAGLTAVPLTDPVVRRRIALVLPRGRQPVPAAAAFAGLLTGSVRRPSLPAHARWAPPDGASGAGDGS